MPALPTAEQLGTPSYSPNRGVVSVQTGQVGQALEQAGQETRRASERVLNYIDDTASLHARAAIVELKRAQNQLAIGEDGYAHKLNGAATAPGVLKDYETRFNDQVSALGANLSPEAKNKFDSMAREQGTHFQAGVLTHIMRQDLSHRGEVYAAQIAVSSETMGLNYNNPEVILSERASIEATVAGYAQKNGIKDKALLERMLQDARGSGHEAVINGYLSAGQAGQAQEYFEVVRKNGGEMTPAKVKSIENMLKPEVAFESGRAIAAELFQLHVSGGSAIEVAVQKRILTEGTSREVVAAVDKNYADLTGALEDDRRDTAGDILMSYLNNEGGSGLDDHRLRALRATDPTNAARIHLQIEQIGRRRASAARAAASGAPSSMADMSLYAEITKRIRDPHDGLTGTGVVAEYGGVLEEKMLKDLVKQANSQGTAVSRMSIDNDLINAAMPKSADNTERRNAFKGYIERKLQAWKEQNPGKFPTRQEQNSLLLAASEEHIDANRYWFQSNVPAYLAEEGSTYPVAFGDKLPGRSKDEKAAAYAYVQNIRDRITPDDPPISDAEILKLWEENN